MKTIRNAAQRHSQVSSSSAKKKNMKKVEYSSTTRAMMKKTLPVSPFFTSRVISARASSTSARTRVET